MNDTLNSRGIKLQERFKILLENIFSFPGSETVDSTSSHEEQSAIPLCTETDCDEIYRTARKGRQVGRGVSLYITIEYFFSFEQKMIYRSQTILFVFE